MHEFYDTVGKGIIFPLRFAGEKLRGPTISRLEQYRQNEWGAILKVIAGLYDRLTWLSESANPLLKPFLERMLSGKSREQLLEQLRLDQERVDIGKELILAVDSEMQAFKEGNPDAYNLYRQLTNLSAAIRPLTSVAFFTIGLGPAHELVVHGLTPIAADLATGTVAAAGGDAMLSGGANLLETRFRRLQTAFTKRRVDWLLKRLNEQVFGAVPGELQAAAEVIHGEAYRNLAQAAARLDKQLADVTKASPALNT